MAKGSVRKKGKKWYYRFYVEDASGKLIQREYVGTESKSETEKLLRQAIEDYEEKNFVAKTENIALVFRFRFPTIQGFGSERWKALPGRT